MARLLEAIVDIISLHENTVEYIYMARLLVGPGPPVALLMGTSGPPDPPVPTPLVIGFVSVHFQAILAPFLSLIKAWKSDSYENLVFRKSARKLQSTHG